MKKVSLLVRGSLAAVLLLVLSGCVAAIGNGQAPRYTCTLGQQLIDLKKARDEGVITEAEYNTQRESFLGQKR